PRNRDHLSIRLIDSDAGFQTAQHRGGASVGAQEKAAARRWRELIIQRGPEVLREWGLKAGRHHANDGRWLDSDSNALSNSVRVGAAIAPAGCVAHTRL